MVLLLKVLTVSLRMREMRQALVMRKGSRNILYVTTHKMINISFQEVVRAASW